MLEAKFDQYLGYDKHQKSPTGNTQNDNMKKPSEHFLEKIKLKFPGILKVVLTHDST